MFPKMRVGSVTATAIKPKSAVPSVMKPIQLGMVFAVVFLLSSLAGAVYAQTQVFTNDIGDSAHVAADGRAVFACDTVMSIETEAEGGWLINKTYQMNWTLRLDSVTPYFLNGTDFHIIFSLPPLENVPREIRIEAVADQIQLSPKHKTDTLSVEFTPTNACDGFVVNPDFPFTIYADGQALAQEWGSGVLHGKCGAAVGVVDPDATLQATALLPPADSGFLTLTAAGAVTALLAVCVLVVVRRRRITRE